ncbi:MAG TPA: cytochrome c maturation protein CcmE [Pseudomonadota bacterium]|nr:cytochrome c maturation protein CcmE [Pseudomonadota bacterium]
MSQVTKNPASLPVASSQRYRPLLLGLSAAAVVGLLVFAMSDSQSFEYYKHVDEVMRDPTSWQDKRLQLHGFVVPGSIAKRIDRDHQKLEYKFRVENCGSVTEARFAGVVPDTFKEGAEVVLKGQLRGDTFHTSEVMAKCPSKYAQEGAQKSAMVTRCSKEGAAEKMN